MTAPHRNPLCVGPREPMTDIEMIGRLNGQLIAANAQLEIERSRRVAAERELAELHQHIAAIERRGG